MRDRIAVWDRRGLELPAPTLFEYELNSSLHYAAAIDLITPDEAALAMREALELEIQCISPKPNLHETRCTGLSG